MENVIRRTREKNDETFSKTIVAYRMRRSTRTHMYTNFSFTVHHMNILCSCAIFARWCLSFTRHAYHHSLILDLLYKSPDNTMNKRNSITRVLSFTCIQALKIFTARFNERYNYFSRVLNDKRNKISSYVSELSGCDLVSPWVFL